MRAVREQRTVASTSTLPAFESAESSVNHSKSTGDLVMLPSVSQLARPSTVSPKKKRNIGFTQDHGTIGFSDFLAVLGPSLLDQSREKIIKTVFAKHAGGKDGATFDAFAAMLEELSPVATVRQNLWAAACKVKASGHKIGATPIPRGLAPLSATEDQSKIIGTLRAKIRELEAQAVNAKSALKLESELQALRRQNAALRKEAATAVAKAYEIKEQTEADVKARGAPHVRLLNKLIEQKDERLEAKSKEIAELKEKLEASEQLRQQETKKLRLQVFKLKQQLGASEEGAAELLEANMRQLHELRSGLLVGMVDEPLKIEKTSSMEDTKAEPAIEAAEPVHRQAAAVSEEGTKEPQVDPRPTPAEAAPRPKVQVPTVKAQPNATPPAKAPALMVQEPAAKAQPKPPPPSEAADQKRQEPMAVVTIKASTEPKDTLDVKAFVSVNLTDAIL